MKTEGIPSRWPNFSSDEFLRATPSCDIRRMSTAFLDRLQTARDLAGCPFVINSAFREVEYELKRNRSGRSYHCLGRAVDISVKDSVTRYRILDALLCAGFHGIGIGKTFIHADDRETSTIWLYD